MEILQIPPFSHISTSTDGTDKLDTDEHTHQKFIFGAIAEFCDNAREAGAKNLEIDWEHNGAIAFTDDGEGMNHIGLHNMFCWGMKGADAPNNFGHGFKSGSMALADEALVLTDDGTFRGMGWLSREFNEDHQNLKIPFFFWHPHGRPATKEAPLESKPYTGNRKEIQTCESIEDILKALFSTGGINPVKDIQDLRKYFKFFLHVSLDNTSGTCILLWSLKPSSRIKPDGNTIKFSHECSARTSFTGAAGNDMSDPVNFQRKGDSRDGGQFAPGVDIPYDYDLRYYLSILYQTDGENKNTHADGGGPMQIKLLKENVRTHNVFDPSFVGEMPKQSYTLKLQSLPSDRKRLKKYTGEVSSGTVFNEVKITFYFSPADYRENRYGLFLFWHDTSQKWSKNTLQPRLVQPYSLLGIGNKIDGLANGLIAKLVLSPQHAKIDNGKQHFQTTFNIGDITHQFATCFDEVLETSWFCEARKNQASVLDLMCSKEVFTNLPCWAFYNPPDCLEGWVGWYPALLLDRFDSSIPKQSKDLELTLDLSKFLVLFYSKKDKKQGKKQDMYGWCDVQDLCQWSLEGPDRSSIDSKKCETVHKDKQCIEKADEIYKKLSTEEEQSFVTCTRCSATRIRKGAKLNDILAWTCSDGYFLSSFSKSKSILCKKRDDVDSGSEDRCRPESIAKGSQCFKDKMRYKIKTAGDELFLTQSKSDSCRMKLLEKPSGTFADIYTAFLSDEPVVVKCYKTEKNAEKHFEKEYALYDNIRHTNIIEMKGYCRPDTVVNDSDCKLAIILAYMPRDLHDAIYDTDDPLIFSEKYQILLGVARGMKHLHEKEYFHLDLKPRNILLDPKNNPKICDLGFAKDRGLHRVYPESASIADPGCGTELYQAPEIQRSTKDSSDLSTEMYQKYDVFSYGAVSVELICKKTPPARIQNDWDKIIEDKLLNEHEKRSETRIKLFELAADCVRKEAALRPKNFEAILKRLDPISDAVMEEQHKESESIVQSAIDKLNEDKISDFLVRHADREEKYLFRVMDLGDIVMAGGDLSKNGLMCKFPYSSLSQCDRVGRGSKRPSRFISTTLSKEWALYYACEKCHSASSKITDLLKQCGFFTFPIAVIDPTKLGPDTLIYDWGFLQKELSKVGKLQDKHGQHSRTLNYAIRAREVTFESMIAGEAIIGFISPKEVQFKKVENINRLAYGKGEFLKVSQWQTKLDSIYVDQNSSCYKELFCICETRKMSKNFKSLKEKLSATDEFKELCPVEVYKNLFVGSANASDQRIWKDQNISFTVAVGDNIVDSIGDQHFAKSLKKKAALPNFMEILNAITNRVIEALVAERKVVVLCNAGKNRCMAVAAFTMMRHWGTKTAQEFSKTYDRISEKCRGKVDIYSAVQKQLKDHEREIMGLPCHSEARETQASKLDGSEDAAKCLQQRENTESTAEAPLEKTNPAGKTTRGDGETAGLSLSSSLDKATKVDGEAGPNTSSKAARGKVDGLNPRKAGMEKDLSLLLKNPKKHCREATSNSAHVAEDANTSGSEGVHVAEKSKKSAAGNEGCGAKTAKQPKGDREKEGSVSEKSRTGKEDVLPAKPKHVIAKTVSSGSRKDNFIPAKLPTKPKDVSAQADSSGTRKVPAKPKDVSVKAASSASKHPPPAMGSRPGDHGEIKKAKTNSGSTNLTCPPCAIKAPRSTDCLHGTGKTAAASTAATPAAASGKNVENFKAGEPVMDPGAARKKSGIESTISHSVSEPKFSSKQGQGPASAAPLAAPLLPPNQALPTEQNVSKSYAADGGSAWDGKALVSAPVMTAAAAPAAATAAFGRPPACMQGTPLPFAAKRNLKPLPLPCSACPAKSVPAPAGLPALAPVAPPSAPAQQALRAEEKKTDSTATIVLQLHSSPRPDRLPV